VANSLKTTATAEKREEDDDAGTTGIATADDMKRKREEHDDADPKYKEESPGESDADNNYHNGGCLHIMLW